MLRRDSLNDKVDKAGVHRILSQIAGDPKEAIEHLHQCRQLMVKRSESPAPLLIEEFRLRLLTGYDIQECDRILNQLPRTTSKNRGSLRRSIKRWSSSA